MLARVLGQLDEAQKKKWSAADAPLTVALAPFTGFLERAALGLEHRPHLVIIGAAWYQGELKGGTNRAKFAVFRIFSQVFAVFRFS